MLDVDDREEGQKKKKYVSYLFKLTPLYRFNFLMHLMTEITFLETIIYK